MAVRDRVARHREQMRARGFRPIEVWVPDVNRAGFADEVRRQAALVNQSDQQEDIMDWIESVSADWDDQNEAE